LDELNEGNRNAVPTYLFIGSATFEGDRPDPTVETIRHSPKWRIAASFGRAEIYGRRLIGPGMPAPTPIGPGQ